MSSEAMAAFGESLVSTLEHEHSQPAHVRDAAKQAFDEKWKGLAGKLRSATNKAEQQIQTAFDESVAPQLQKGAESAQSDALAKAQEWGIPVTQGGLHCATYKATCRRGGVFRLNMNEELGTCHRRSN